MYVSVNVDLTFIATIFGGPPDVFENGHTRGHRPGDAHESSMFGPKQFHASSKCITLHQLSTCDTIAAVKAHPVNILP